MKDNNLFEKAAQQILSEVLGYDEGKSYFLLLTKRQDELEKEFSYSKRYRILKNLYEFGAVGKFKPNNQEFFNYFIIPPTFLYDQADVKIIEYLESIYLKNYSDIILNNFSQMMLKDEINLLFFFLKYFMKENAKIKGDKVRLGKVIKEATNINIIDNKESKRRIGLIDKNFAFEFVDIPNKNSYESIGYFANSNSRNNKDYISIIEEEINRLSHF